MRVGKGNTLKLRKLRMNAAARGILSVAQLARLVPCSRVAVYLALENPSRFSRVTKRIKELTTFSEAN